MRRELNGSRRTALAAAGGLVCVSLILAGYAKGVASRIGTYDGVVSGTISPISAPRDGLIQSIDVEPGRRVKAGDILVHMYDRDAEARVQQRRAELLAIELEVEATRLRNAQMQDQLLLAVEEAEQKRQEQTARVKAREIELDRLQRQYERIDVLVKKKSVSKAEHQDAAAARDVAEAELEAARSGLELAEVAFNRAKSALALGNVNEADLRRLEQGMAKKAEAALAEAEAVLEQTVLRAPADGWVVDWRSAAGASVDAGACVVDLWLADRRWVEVEIDQRDLAIVKVAHNVEVRLEAFPDTPLPGVVQSVQIRHEADGRLDPNAKVMASPLLPKSAVYAVRVMVADDPAFSRLLPGLAATVDFDMPMTDEDRLLVSSAW